MGFGQRRPSHNGCSRWVMASNLTSCFSPLPGLRRHFERGSNKGGSIRSWSVGGLGVYKSSRLLGRPQGDAPVIQPRPLFALL